MARVPSPVGPDLLYHVWTSRAANARTAELARSLLHSLEVKSKASPALAVALELREASSCEAMAAALPRAQAHADTRSINSLVKLTYRRGCGASKRDDCYPCLRAIPEQLFVSTKAANGRRPPSYPAFQLR